MLRPVEVEVDSDTIAVEVEIDNTAIVLSVVDRPLDSEAMPLDADVDSIVRLLSVVDRPLDKDAMPLDAEVDKEVIVLSVVEATSCRAPFGIGRSRADRPRRDILDLTLGPGGAHRHHAGRRAGKRAECHPSIVTVLTLVATLVVAPAPSATLLATVTWAPEPSATPSLAEASTTAVSPIAIPTRGRGLGRVAERHAALPRRDGRIADRHRPIGGGPVAVPSAVA